MVASHRQDRIYKPALRATARSVRPPARSTPPRSRPRTTRWWSFRTAFRRCRRHPAEATGWQHGNLSEPGRAPAAARSSVSPPTTTRRSPSCHRHNWNWSCRPGGIEARQLAELNPASQQVFCFENSGADIGVTLDHPHGQIQPLIPSSRREPARVLTSVADNTVPRTGETSSTTGSPDQLDEGRPDRAAPPVAGPPSSRMPRAGRTRCTHYPNERVPDLAALEDRAAGRAAVLCLFRPTRPVPPVVPPAGALHLRLAPGTGRHRPTICRRCTWSCSPSAGRRTS